MSFRTKLPAALFLTAALCSGCGIVSKQLGKAHDRDKPKEEAKDAPKQDVVIGLIEMVNPEQQFVLVRTETRLNLAAGTKLETRPQTGIRSSLIVTPEKKQNFISADIVAGLPQRGDLVIMPAGGEPPTTPTPMSTTPEAMIPGVAPSNPTLPPLPSTQPPVSGGPQGLPVPPLPGSPPPPGQPVPSVPLPPGTASSIDAPVDPLPPPIQ